jgi:hypothetical protein
MSEKKKARGNEKESPGIDVKDGKKEIRRK